MAKITHIEAVFDNGNKLILRLQEEAFATYYPKQLYSVFFAEYAGDHYEVCQTEFFPETEFGKAMSAFTSRMNSNNPMNESGQGYDLDVLLVKKDKSIFLKSS